MWTAAAIVGSAVVGGAVQANSAKKASSAQGRSEERALEEQRRQNTLARQDLAPWRNTGKSSLDLLSDRLGLNPGRVNYLQAGGDSAGFTPVFTSPDNPEGRTNIGPVLRPDQFNAEAYLAANPDVANAGVDPYQHYQRFGRFEERTFGSKSQPQGQAPGVADLLRDFTTADFENDPVNQLSFKYGMDMGTKGIDRGAGAAGLRNSGATLKALTRFGQDYAGSKANESRNRFMNFNDTIFNRLSGVAGTGQTATTNTAMMGQDSSNNIANTLTAGGNARGAAAIAQGNAYGGAINTVGNYYGQQATLNKILQNSKTPQASQPYYTGYGSGGDYQYG